MDNVSSIAELLAISWTYVSKLLSFVNIRNEGYAIIKRRWGKPVKVYDLSERWCWKWPIAEKFDIVDIRKQVIYLNAHSVKNDDGSKNIIPFNTTIDAQCEFRIVNPNVIYKISDDIVKTENNYTTIESYVDNTVHILISRIIRQNGLSSITNANIQEMMDRELARFNRGHPQGFEKGFDFRISHAILILSLIHI